VPVFRPFLLVIHRGQLYIERMPRSRRYQLLTNLITIFVDIDPLILTVVVVGHRLSSCLIAVFCRRVLLVIVRLVDGVMCF